MAFWLGAQKMVKASEEERFLMEIPLFLAKQKPWQYCSGVYVVNAQTALETNTHSLFFVSLSSFSSHIVGVCLRNANEFKY